MFFFSIIGLLTGTAIGARVDGMYNGAVIGAKVGVVADLMYLGAIQAGSMRRNWLGGHTEVVNVFITPLDGSHSHDPDYVEYRRWLLANRAALEQQLNHVNPGNTRFNVIDGRATTARGYCSTAKTMTIALDWRDGSRIIAQGLDWTINVYPKGFKSQLGHWMSVRGLHSVPDQQKATYLANVMLHEVAHVVLDRAWFRQWFGWRDHTSTGLMAGFPFGSNMPFDVASQAIMDYDDSTLFSMQAALGSKWAWY
ncbi:MAG: hypothetical protein RBS80_29915 [Thermoguttaceae bacterium]|jgi:hypothetical protein|nr:hypothetical protein [Thermoguttaceae bacterium]